MSGLVCAGVVVPTGRFRGRAVAGGDEDAITLAAEAAEACLDPVDPSDISAIFLATTSRPVPSGSPATLVSRMIGLPETTRAVDFSGSVRCGLSALLAAVDTVDAGIGGSVLVVAAEANGTGTGARDSAIGDGAAALIVSPDGTLATFGPRLCITGEKAARVMSGATGGDGLDDVGPTPYSSAVGTTLKRLFLPNRLGAGDFRYALFDAPDAGSRLRVCRDMGFGDPSRVLSPEDLAAGHCGAATPLMLLASALENAAPDERLLSVACGDGAEAVVLTVGESAEGTPAAVRMRVRKGRELSFEDLVRLEERRVAGSDELLEETHLSAADGASGLACGECGGVYALPLRVCPSCRTKDAFRRTPLGRKGIVYTMTVEHGFSAGGGAVTFVSANLLGGGRALVPVAESAVEEIIVGDEVELLLRRVGTSKTGPVYHLKARKLEEA